MTDEIINLGAARSAKSGNSRDWSVLDALREAIKAVESGEFQADMVYIALTASLEGSEREFTYFTAGGGRLQIIGLLAENLQARTRT